MILTALAAGAVALLSGGVGWLIGRPAKKQQKRKSFNTLATITVAALAKGYVVDASGAVFVAMEQLPDAETWIKTSGSKRSR